MSELNPYLKRY